MVLGVREKIDTKKEKKKEGSKKSIKMMNVILRDDD